MELLRKAISCTLLTNYKKIVRLFSWITSYYFETANVQNNKLMKPTIKRAYLALQVQIFIVTSIHGIFILCFTTNQNYAITLMAFVIIIGVCLGTFCCSNIWITKALDNNKILLATNIYFVANIYIIILTTLGFKYLEGCSEYDRAIAMIICFYFIVHFFDLIPGNILIKLGSYCFSVIFIVIMYKPLYAMELSYFVGISLGTLSN